MAQAKAGRSGPLKRVIDIEDALQWAFVEELPKRRPDGPLGMREFPSVCPMFRMMATGPVDNFSREPGFPIAVGTDPHPDALRIEQAVADLSPHEIDIAGYARAYGTDPVGVDVDILAANFADQVGALVISRARLRRRPSLGDDQEIERVLSANGKPAVFRLEEGVLMLTDADYSNLKGHRRVYDRERREEYWPPDSFCNIRYSPGRIWFFEEQAEYATWRAALDLLADRLADELETIQVAPPKAARQPWNGDHDAGGRVLPDLSGTMLSAGSACFAPGPGRPGSKLGRGASRIT